MSGSGRKRSSKWDLRDEPHFDDINVQDEVWSGKAGRPFRHRESGHGWHAPELDGSNGSKWSALESNDLRSKHGSGFPSREPFPGSRGLHKNENTDKDCNRYVEESMSWDRDGSYGTRMSPGLDDWRQQNHSQSPKSGHSRSLRGRSKSRSRSRSRSPLRSFRRESGFLDRSRSRPGVSGQLCKDFVTGRCRRGSHCQFLHQCNEDYEDNWDYRQRKGGSSRYSTPRDAREYPLRSGRSTYCSDFVKGRCRRGESCKFEHHGAPDGFSKGSVSEVSREKENDRRKRDTSIEQSVDREPRRSSDIPCKFFAAGNCRNGKYCRFSHHSQTCASPNGKSQHDKWGPGHKLDDVCRLWDGPKWKESDIVPNAAKLSEDKNGIIGAQESRSTWSVNDNGWGSSLNNDNETCGEPTVSHEAAKIIEKEALQWKADNAGSSMGLSESKHAEKWLGGMDMSPDWNYAIQSSNYVVKKDNSHIARGSECLNLNDMSLTTRVPSLTEDPSAGRMHGTTEIVQPMIIDKSLIQQNHDDKNAVGNIGSLHADPNMSGKAISAQSFDQNGQHSSSFPLSSLNIIGQSQAVIPTEAQKGILKNPRNNILSPDGKCVIKPDFGDAKTSLVNSGIPPTQKMVSGEQINQLNNLSASLAQLFGNGQQLPQLYATLSSNNAVEPLSSATVLLDPAIGSQKYYDPICDNIESKKPEISNNPPGVLSNPIIQKSSLSDGKPEIKLKNLTPLPFPGGPDGADCYQTGCSVRPNQNSNHLSCEVSMGKEEMGDGESNKAQEDNNKAQENGPLEEIEKDGADDTKKSKDMKGTRAFKFALVEFVKELLKPTWKEGQISKDAYKTIVKKVVDKVTGTMQGANIPQTQEKIDHYLSLSKPKLTKLVQAYVDKSQKG